MRESALQRRTGGPSSNRFKGALTSATLAPAFPLAAPDWIWEDFSRPRPPSSPAFPACSLCRKDAPRSSSRKAMLLLRRGIWAPGQGAFRRESRHVLRDVSNGLGEFCDFLADGLVETLARAYVIVEAIQFRLRRIWIPRRLVKRGHGIACRDSATCQRRADRRRRSARTPIQAVKGHPRL